MKTTKITLTMAILMVAGSLVFTSCRKKEQTTPEEPDNEQSSAADNSLAENTVNDVAAMGSQLSENTGTFTTFKTVQPSAEAFMFSAGCATITPAFTNSAISSCTVDFGTAGCVGQDYRTRKGKIFFDFSGSTGGAKYYRSPGFKMTVTSAGYEVDGNQVSITKTITNTSNVSLGETAYSGNNLKWSIDANVTINKAGGGTVSWTCSRTKELINSNDPLCYKGQLQAVDWTKAKVKLNGSASGTNARSESYTAVAADLIRDFTCAPDGNKPHRHPFISGTVDYTPGNRATRHIDYGSGAVYPNTQCDFNANVTINGQTFTITIQ
jgi:hypothetical protein